MPTFVPEPRLGSLLSVDRLVGKCSCVVLLTVSVVAEETAEIDIEGKDVEAERKKAELETSEVEVGDIEMLGIDALETLENLSNRSRGVAWKA